MRSLILLGMGLALIACRARHGVHIGGPHVRVGTEEDVHDKRFEWFQGLRSDCVHRHLANACFKTGQNLEDGVVSMPNERDAHWYYAEACALQNYDQYCYAADRTAPREHEHHHHSDHDAER